MGKILEYRETLSLEEAAKYLGRFFDEPLSEADVLRLSLDGYLTVTADLFNLAPGHLGHVVSEENARMWISTAEDAEPSKIPLPEDRLCRVSQLNADLRALIDEGKVVLTLADDIIPGSGIVQFSNKISALNGLWDLPMLGAERYDVESRFRRLTGVPDVNIEVFEPYYLQQSTKRFAQLMEASGTYGKKDPALFVSTGKFNGASALPEDAQLVIRRTEIERLEQSITAERRAPIRPLATSERNTLDCVIAILSRKAGIDPEAHGSATKIARLAERAGIQLSVETVRKILRRIPDALEARTK